MPINMTDYKMIVHDRVYNVLQMVLMLDHGPSEKAPTVKFIEAVYINEDGSIQVIRDDAKCFQFVRRTN